MPRAVLDVYKRQESILCKNIAFYFKAIYIILCGIFSLSNIFSHITVISYTIPVSYTHLDVYKRQAVNYAQNHHDTLMNYMIDGRCEISNNRAERKAKSYAEMCIRDRYSEVKLSRLNQAVSLQWESITTSLESRQERWQQRF